MNELWIMKDDSLNLQTILKDGRCPYSGATVEKYPKSEGWLHLVEDDAIKLLDLNQEKAYVGKWSEITEKEYFDMLEILPPLKMRCFGTSESFFISEATISNIHDLYVEYRGRYFLAGRRLTVRLSDVVLEINLQFFKAKDK